MRFSKTKAVVLSAAVTLLCLVALVVGTVAIFSDSADTNVHLQAGTLAATFERTRLSGSVLNEDGTVGTMTPEETPIDLSESTDPVFAVADFIPGMWREAEFRITNGGDIAFDCSLEFGSLTLQGASGSAQGEASESLSEQLIVTVYNGTGDDRAQLTTFRLSALDSQPEIELGSLVAPAQGASSEMYFTVRVEFDMGTDVDNSAQGGDLTFDLTLYAEQQTA